MSPTDWKAVRFSTTGEALGVPYEETLLRFEDLKDRYNENHRFYHCWDHIMASLNLMDEVESEGLVMDPYCLEWAIYHHDAIYSTKWSKANEELSARLAVFRINPNERDKIQRLILYTEPGMPAGRFRDDQLMQDIDLGILGATPEDYATYAARIRCEYMIVPHEEFNKGRIAVMSQFLNRETIYLTDYFRAKYETQARENLAVELAQLQEELKNGH